MRILLVEDDTRLAAVVRQSLIDRGHVVDAEVNGRRGLDVARSDAYDAIILDVMLPGLDGFSVLRTLRRERLKTPVLILTARDGAHDVIAGLDAGADDYVRKPFVLGELEARLRAITRREVSALPAQELIVADIVMDLTSRRVRRGERAIELSPRETAFLEYFMRRPEVLIRRTMLEEALWESDRDTVSNLIEVYVSRLRRKLGAAGEPNLIETVRGIGYRFGTAVGDA
jgi:two-component system, OmpR family, response regulator